MDHVDDEENHDFRDDPICKAHHTRRHTHHPHSRKLDRVAPAASGSDAKGNGVAARAVDDEYGDVTLNLCCVALLALKQFPFESSTLSSQLALMDAAPVVRAEQSRRDVV